jgi:hypothetical protein
LGGCRGHWGSLSLNDNWLYLWRCRLDWLDWLDGLDGWCRSLAPLASSLLAGPSWCWLWLLWLLPLWLLWLSPTWLASWEASRLATWETSRHRSWEAPLVVGLAESQRAARGPAKDLLPRGCRGQRLGGSREHASKG